MLDPPCPLGRSSTRARQGQQPQHPIEVTEFLQRFPNHRVSGDPPLPAELLRPWHQVAPGSARAPPLPEGCE